MQDDAKLQNTCASASGPHRPRQGQVGCKYSRTSCSAKITSAKIMTSRTKLGDWHQKPTTEQNAARLTYRTHVQRGQAHIRPRKGRVGSKYCLTSAKIIKRKLQCKMMQNCRTHVRARQAHIGHDKARWVVSTLALLVVPRLLQLRS